MIWNPFRRKESPKGEFSEVFRAAAGRLGLGVQACDESGATLSLEGQEERVSFFHIKRSVQNAKQEVDSERLSEFVSSLRDALLSHARTRASLASLEGQVLPRLSTPAEVEEAHAPGRLLVPGHLRVGLVLDRGSAVDPVLEKDLDRWSTSFEHVYQVALANLERSTTREKLTAVGERSGLFTYSTGDAYDAARALLLTKLVDPWPADGVILLVPARDVLLCVPLATRDAVAAMNAMFLLGRQIFQEASYGLSDQPFWFDGARWEHIPVVSRGATMQVLPPPNFAAAVDRL